ncbi:Npl4, partial [Symbiodinium necroappetens]
VVLESAKVLKTISEVCGSILVEVLELTAEDRFESGVPAGERHWRLLLASATAVLDDRQAYAAYQVRLPKMVWGLSEGSTGNPRYRHIDTLSVINVPEMESFIGYWQGVLLENAMQRAGFMYGYYLEDKNYDEGTRAIMEAIYEPQQEMAGEVAEMVKDDQEMSRVNRIAEALGLECIGWVFTSLPLEDGLLLSPEEVVRIARLQNDHSTDKHFTKYTLSKFVSCAVRPDPAHNGAPGINPFMVSEQACAMLRDGILTATPSERRACVVRE